MNNNNLLFNLSDFHLSRAFFLYTDFEKKDKEKRSRRTAKKEKMGAKDIIIAILTLLSGIGIFLVACSMMSSNLESVGSNRLRSLFSKASGSNLLGVGIGAVGTAAIQSSGATTVMIIGFVNAGIMSLKQAACIIYGANIGTTITGQIVALGLLGSNAISTTVIFSAFAGIGAFITTFAKKDTIKKIGGILAGFGMLFVGLKLMSGSMESFAQMDGVRNFLASINNALLLVVIGAVFTAIVQSSSVMTSVAITMVVTGLISLEQGIYITMGSNIGSCVVALLAGLTSSTNAKRTSLIHLLFNVGGVILFMLAALVLRLTTGGTINFGLLFERMFPGVPQTQLAMFHTAFNIVTVLLVLPLTDALLKLVEYILPERRMEKREETEEYRLFYVDEHMLRTPPIAVRQVKNEICNMAEIAYRNFETSLKIICTLDFEQEAEFARNEKELNFINRELVDFVVKLAKRPLNERDRMYLATAIRSISDLERVGDYAENIVEYAQSLRNSEESFSVSAVAEVDYLKENINALFTHAMKAYIDFDRDALDKAEEFEDQVDKITNRMADNHIIRLNDGVCSPLVGAQYLSLSMNAERIADHFMNIAHTIKAFR